MSGTDTPIKIFPEKSMFFIRQVFADRNGSEEIPYPVTDDTALTYGQITAICRNTECYHSSLRQNASPPGKTANTQIDHFPASVCAYVRHEMLEFSDKLNHSALKTKIHITALSSAFEELKSLKITVR